jgi:hypothetical protein
VAGNRGATNEFVDHFGGPLQSELVHLGRIALGRLGRLGRVTLGRLGLGRRFRLRHGGALDLRPCASVVRVRESFVYASVDRATATANSTWLHREDGS